MTKKKNILIWLAFTLALVIFVEASFLIIAPTSQIATTFVKTIILPAYTLTSLLTKETIPLGLITYSTIFNLLLLLLFLGLIIYLGINTLHKRKY